MSPHAASDFRHRYLSYDALTDQLATWQREHPDLVRVASLGSTPEGREQWMITIGPDPDRPRPAVWVDGNMHAIEVCGSSVALAIAEDALRNHLAPDEPLHDLSDSVRASLREVLFHVVPRISPDGAERVLQTGQYVRSVPRDARANRSHPRWIGADIDGDGVALVMRVEDPTGEFTESPNVKGLLVLRELGDTGPFYKVYPEGRIEHFDGRTIPSPSYLHDFEPDLNRNFPTSWRSEPHQAGAGRFPLSEPESRSIAEFASSHPNLFAWLNLHTFGGVFIRPCGDRPDNKMNPSDLALFRQLEAWGDELTGYPTVSGFEEFTYEPDTPLHGDLTDFAYHDRGCIAYVCELWDLFERAEIPRPKRFVERYSHLTRDDVERLARWDRDHNGGRVFLPWRPFDHPQLGRVELGGIDPRIGLWNPPPGELPGVCTAQAAMFLRVAAMAPQVVIGPGALRREGETTTVEAEVANHGYLPTYILASAKDLPWNEPLYAELSTNGCTLTDPGEARRLVGHLDGWGRGRFDGSAAVYYLRSRGSTGRASIRVQVRGHGTVTLRVGSCRVGWTERTFDV